MPDFLDAIEQRLKLATPGPWKYRPGKHTGSPKTSDAGGIVSVPLEHSGPEENVLFPVGVVSGDPTYLRLIRKSDEDRLPICLALELMPQGNDLELICHAPTDLAYLLARLEKAEALRGAAQAAHNLLLEAYQITDGVRIARVRELLDVALTAWQEGR